MNLLSIRLMMIGGILLSFCSFADADEVDELFAKAKALKTESRELLENGHEDAARTLERRSNELLELAEQMAVMRKTAASENKSHKARHPEHSDIQHLKERIKDLEKARIAAIESKSNVSESELNALDDKRRSLERALEQAIEQREKLRNFPPEVKAQMENLEIANRRLKHIRVAAENLKAAEMHDLAHELTSQADEMERDIHNAKAEIGHRMHGGKPDESHKENDKENDIRRLKMENEELRQQMQKLTEIVERLSQAQAK